MKSIGGFDEGSINVLAPTAQRVATRAPDGLLLKGFREVLRAAAVVHADAVRIGVAAWAVQHTSLDDGAQACLLTSRGDLRAHQKINVLRGLRFGRGIHDEEDVSMRKASLLELDRVGVGTNVPEHVVLQKQVEETTQLEAEDAGHQAWSVVHGLSWTEA